MTSMAMERSLVDFDVDELELFLAGREVSPQENAPDNLQLLADVAIQERGQVDAAVGDDRAVGAVTFPSPPGNRTTTAGDFCPVRGKSQRQGNFPVCRSTDTTERREQNRAPPTSTCHGTDEVADVSRMR